MRHRGEDHSGHPRQGEERNECKGDDQRGEEQRAADLAGGFGDALLQGPPPARPEVPVDVLHHDHGGLDDDAEVHGAERDQVRRRSGEDHPAEGRHQRERDVHGGHCGRARLPEEYPEHEGDEQHADEQVLQDRIGGQFHQLVAVVVGLDLHADGEHVVLADELDALVHALQRLQR